MVAPHSAGCREAPQGRCADPAQLQEVQVDASTAEKATRSGGTRTEEVEDRARNEKQEVADIRGAGDPY